VGASPEEGAKMGKSKGDITREIAAKRGTKVVDRPVANVFTDEDFLIDYKPLAPKEVHKALYDIFMGRRGK
jgi:hypothetical protein